MLRDLHRRGARASWFALPWTKFANVKAGLRLVCSWRLGNAGGLASVDAGSMAATVTAAGEEPGARRRLLLARASSWPSATASVIATGWPCASVASSVMRTRKALLHPLQHEAVVREQPVSAAGALERERAGSRY
jgi:hypothetical protein